METNNLLNKISNKQDNEDLMLKHIKYDDSFLYLKSFENSKGIQFAIVESNDGDVYHFALTNLEIDKVITKELSKLNKQIDESNSFERDFS